MAKIDTTKQVMDKVIRFEKKRSGQWYQRYWFILTLLALSVVFGGKIIWERLSSEDAWFFLGFYFADWEIFQVLWQEALSFVWDLTPREWLVASFAILLVIVFVMLVTRNKRFLIKRRLASIKGGFMQKQKGNIAIIIAIVLAALSAGGIFMVNKKNMVKQEAGITPEAVKTTSPAPTIKKVTPAPDTSLDQDFSALDAKMKDLDSQMSAIDTGLNDQMGDLSE